MKKKMTSNFNLNKKKKNNNNDMDQTQNTMKFGKDKVPCGNCVIIN